MNKYQQIANDIEKYIHDNNLEQGTKLQSLDMLMKEYEVSKSTITKALDTLERRGVIFQQRGSGIFVRRQKRTGYVSLLTNRGFTEDLKEFNISTQVLKLELVPADEEVAHNLHINEGENVYYVERLRYKDDEILCLETSYFPKAIVTYLNNEIVSASIFNYLSEALKLNISFSDVYINVDQLDQRNAEVLELPADSPALFLEQVVYLATGEPFDYSKIVYHYQNSKFFVQAMNF